MPIGVPRIIYCWGEELPAQWTDIYNFIFRRRMVFLMQYLDDELCNQICGLLINIHMEDRSKELEKKEMERSGVFKSSSRASQTQETKKKGGDLGSVAFAEGEGTETNKEKQDGVLNSMGETSMFHKKQSRSFEDLLNADEDLGIDDIDTLEQNTLQKITTEWLNWNAQFFDYSDEPYIFYLAELLSKDFDNNSAKNSLFSSLALPFVQTNQKMAAVQTEGAATRYMGEKQSVGNLQQVQKISKLLQILKRSKKLGVNSGDSIKNTFVSAVSPIVPDISSHEVNQNNRDTARQEVAARLGKQQLIIRDNTSATSLLGNVYSPFRTYVTFELENYNLRKLISLSGFQKLLQKLEQVHIKKETQGNQREVGFSTEYTKTGKKQSTTIKNKVIYTFLSNFIQKKVTNNLFSLQQISNYSAKALGQRHLRREYGLEHNLSILLTQGSVRASFIERQSTSDTKTENKKGAFVDKSYALPRVCNPSSYVKSFAEGLSTTQTLVGKETWKDKVDFAKSRHDILKSFSYLDSSMLNSADSYTKIQKSLGAVNSLSREASGSDNKSSNDRALTRDYYRKQTERALIDEESKKVFVIINSFGGSVGNGITIHDALQFIKAGSLTLGLGVAASAASLALAGGTIGERYVTEGCHVMIHQPEGGLQGQASDIWIDSQEIMKIRLDVAEIYSLATYRPRHKILRDLDRDFYLTAMETIHYGLADEIATNEVMRQIVEMTSKVWDFQDSKQQRLLEARESASSGMDTQTQS